MKPKNTEKIYWTKHSIEKMRYYGISEQRVKRILKAPDRVEEGIAPGTIAMMQRAGSKKRPHEIWTMFAVQLNGKKQTNKRGRKIIISCWRYPGVSPRGREIPIPEEIREEIEIEIKKIQKNG